jgi:aminoglycoside 3-N-acetyltransferase
MGADLDTLTVLHHAEYLAPVLAKRPVRRHRVVAGDGAPELRVVDCLDDNHGIVDYPGDDYFAVILRQYLAPGRASTGIVGRARSELIDAADVVEFGVEWMTEHLVRT